jgi:hypothetical protein
MPTVSGRANANEISTPVYERWLRCNFSLVDETDPRAKYRALPPNVDSDDLVVEVDVDLAQVEQADQPDYNSGADPYLRIVGWKQP